MDDNVFKINFGNDEDCRWEKLITEIVNGNVIPVIGPDILVEPKISLVDNYAENLHQQLISFIANSANVKSNPHTFSQLVYDLDYRKMVKNRADMIYNLLKQILDNVNVIDSIRHEAGPMLLDLLATKRFPFVITTSFTPIVEQAMRKIWGEDKVKVLQFNNNPKDSMVEGIGDISSENDLRQPTVFYMFGKYSNRAGSYVVTDLDMINFCRSWMTGNGIPKTLTETLKRKYLLLLGNNYPDWLFRFVWYGLHPASDIMKSDVIVKDKSDESLSQFLEHIDTFTQTDPAYVVERIKAGLEQMGSKPVLQTEFKTDVFISYSRSDSPIAEKLHDSLVAKGLKVWFDVNSIEKGADWKSSIINGIHSTKLFVPILSQNIEKESLIPHEYRIEWSEAASLSSKMGGRAFIVPLAAADFDFYNPLSKIPKEFSDKNAARYTSEGDVAAFVDSIVLKVEELKELEGRLA